MRSTSPVAKYHLIEVTLAARIREGAYDERGLPAERELAREFQAARVTIRNALSRLEDQGLVLRTARKGTVAVSGRTAAPKRRLLRDHVDKFLDRGRDDKRKVLKFGLVPATPMVAQALGLDAGETVLAVVRMRFDPASPLTYTEVFVPRHIAPAVGRAALERHAFVELLEKAGVQIGTAQQSVGSEGAPLAASRALAIPLHSPVLKLTRILYGPDGAPLQLLLGWYRADRFEIRMQMSRAEDATRVWVAYR